MTLSREGHHGDVSRRDTYLSVRSPTKPATGANKVERLSDPWVRQMERQVADLKRRIPILKRLIDNCDRMAADLDQEIRNEEDRVKIHDPAAVAYSTYAKASASRRDNLRHSAAALRTHLARAEKALVDLGEPT
jgi:hypothetical protein